jgi:PadR family transcriptional regulator, regulatory protein PadR
MATVTEPAFFVLLSLVDEPRHGYGIVGTVDDLSEGRVRLRVGTLYGVLDRLAAEGLVEHDREEVASGRLRRYYRLTDDGRGALDAEAARQAENARLAGVRLRAHPAPRAASPPPPAPARGVVALGGQA